jgi:hypothetical protein
MQVSWHRHIADRFHAVEEMGSPGKFGEGRRLGNAQVPRGLAGRRGLASGESVQGPTGIIRRAVRSIMKLSSASDR